MNCMIPPVNDDAARSARKAERILDKCVKHGKVEYLVKVSLRLSLFGFLVLFLNKKIR